MWQNKSVVLSGLKLNILPLTPLQVQLLKTDMKDNYVVLHIPSYNDLFKLTFSLEDHLRQKQFPEHKISKAFSSPKPSIQDQSAKLPTSLGLWGSTRSCH